MKYPNGFGSITKLSGKRRNPWRVRKTKGWVYDENGKPKQTYINIGCYATRADALQALALYNENPYEIKPSVTFADVYEKWSERRFNEISESNIGGYMAAYNLCGELSLMRFQDIKLIHLQHTVDTCGKNYPTLKKLKTLFNQLFDYAVQNEIIPKDRHIVEYVNIGQGIKSNKHYRFTNTEIDALWRWSPNNEYVQLILMLIYSGVRPGELFSVKTCDVYLTDCYFRIRQGKNQNAIRIVPIHDRTFPFFENWLSKGREYLITQLDGSPIRFVDNHSQFCESYWDPVLKDVGIYEYTTDDGIVTPHLPDDTRHTFTTMWSEKGLNESIRRKIQGHSGKGIGEQVYTHFDIEVLRTELNKL